MAVYLLDEDIWFPPPEGADEDGLLAVGGDLRPERLLLAYSNGIFPWFNEDVEILWWCPKKRFVIIPGEIRVSKSMKKFMKKTDLRVTVNRDFSGVIHNCRKLREGKEGTWITDGMEDAYNNLHRLGFAASVEVYDGENLAGGLYGVVLGRCFFGESMFSLVPNASKLALISLSGYLQQLGFYMIDCQFHTDHLESMGGRFISYEEYMGYIERGIETGK
ncbi:MAG: leucyl/phenylalanyl-tRNA--protein transferase [Lachnospiraceae bacterium]|nr:leucyl/phenylalanyl-tRNA--protein transferase [Lachnospiraceae bacterium]